MSNISNLRRFFLFAIGLLIGYLIYLGINWGKMERVSWMPGSQVINKIKTSELIFTKKAKLLMICNTITELEIKETIDSGEVDFSKSKTSEKPCPSYIVEGMTQAGRKVRLTFRTCEETVKVIDVVDIDQFKSCE